MANRTARICLIFLSLLLYSSVGMGSVPEVAVIVDHSRILQIRGVNRVAVAQPEIADVAVVSPEEIILTGKRAGETTLHIWHRGGRLSRKVIVYDDSSRLEQAISKAIGLEGVHVSLVNRKAILQGHVASSQERERAVQIAGAYADAVIDLLGFPSGGSSLQTLEGLISRIDQPGVTVSLINDHLLLEGRVATSQEYARVDALARAWGSPVLNLVEVDEETLQQQIALAIGEPTVEITCHGDTVFLEGSVPHEGSARRAELIAGAYAQRVVNLLQIEPRPQGSPGPFSDQVVTAIDRPHLQISQVGSTLFLEGEVTTDRERQRAVAIGKAFGLQVVDLLVVKAGDSGELAQQIREAIGSGTIQVEQHRDTIFLQGTAADEGERDRAVSIAQAFHPQVVSFIQVVQGPKGVAPTQLPEALERLLDRPGIRVTVVEGTIFLEGHVANGREGIRAVEMARAFGLPVVDLLQVSPLEEPRHQELVRGVSQALASPQIQVQIHNETLFLEGTVVDEWSRRRALAIAEAFWPQVVDLLQLEGEVSSEAPSQAPEELVEQIAALIGRREVEVAFTEGKIILEGLAANEGEWQRAQRLAEAFGLPVLNLLEIPAVDSATDVGARQRELLAHTIREAIGNDSISVEVFNNKVFLEGQVATPLEEKRALHIASALADDVVNLLQVTVKPVPIEEDPVFSDQSPADHIGRIIADPQITVSLVGETLVLEGTVDSQFQRERAERLAGILHEPLLNLIQVQERPAPTLAEKIARQIGRESVQVIPLEQGVLLEGTLQNQRELKRALEITESYTTEFINLLDVEKPWQVLLQVQAIEIDRQAASQLGLEWGTVIRGLFTPNMIQFGEEGVGGPWRRPNSLAVQLEALIEEGNATILASPSLLTLSGEEATFLAGGEIPVVIVRGEDIRVDWESYGVFLHILPEVVAGGREVMVTVNPEVSTLDWQNAVQVGGNRLPALTTRRVETKVRVESGATLILGGMIQNQESKQVAKVPILGDLPVIGPLFRSESFRRQETELLFFITPWVMMGHGEMDTSQILSPGEVY
ncbi:MAG: BON domain-containing protein [Limnochordia bacterium]|jgi:pilus assembly protein CpaC